MKLGIMQPYIFPYIGYFQLISLVDQFVVHDDVQWIKGGWINRNRILVGGAPQYITFPVQKDSTLLKINEREFALDSEKQKKKIIRQIEGAYRNAPYFDSVFQLVCDCLNFREQNASAFIVNAMRASCTYLGIDTPIVLSSNLEKNNDLRAQARVLEICRVVGASHYINPIGGIDLYDKRQFAANGLRLSFLSARSVPYPQAGPPEFVPFLSIIDVMMFNSPQNISGLLKEFDLS
jgi:hypothetical protein